MSHNDWYDVEGLSKRVTELADLSEAFDSYWRSVSTEERVCSCTTCSSALICEFAYDPYNTDGDCLSIK